MTPLQTPAAAPVVVSTQAQSPDAFFADRKKFWASFTGFGTIAAVVIATILILLRIFLV